MERTGRLAGKVAIVTGGGAGIGEGTSKVFAAEGAAVAVAGRTLSKVERVVQEIGVAGGRALAIMCDVNFRDQVDAAELAGKFGGGGHRRAAGIELALPLREAEATVLAEVRARMNDLG